MLHTYSKVFKTDVVLLIVRLAVLAAVTLTVPVVLFPVSGGEMNHGCQPKRGWFVNFFSACRFVPPSISSCARPRISTGFVTSSSPWSC